MPEHTFLDYLNQFQHQERTDIQLDSWNRPMSMTPELELTIRKLIREEVNKAIGEMTRRMHGGETIETK